MTRSAASGQAEPAAPALRPGDLVEIAVTDLLSNGQGVGRAAGVVVFAWGPLPGERARVRITLVKAKYAVGDLLELLATSPERSAPFCRVFGVCGGCQVQHLGYAAQLAWKRTMVESALRRIGGIREAHVDEPIGMANPRAYRNKMALVVRPASPGAEFGFYQARSHDIVPVETCPVVAPQLDRTIELLWAAARQPQTAAAFADARHVVARVGRSSGGTVLSITTARSSPTLRRLAGALERALPGVVGIANAFEPASPNAVTGRKGATVAGRADIEEEIGGVTFRVSAASFFQINSEMVGKIFEFLRPQVRQGTRIIDVYCGAGTFSLFFAALGATVVGIEENPNAVREARANAERNGLASSASFVAGRSERLLRTGASAEALIAADVVFLDPPRKGSDEVTLGTIAAARVPSIWYLSCNPSTLARDLVQLIAAGYALGAVQPFDMFPQTGHIEALAMLRWVG
jgi:23S rRNA (uracil1939-C5)-methyltransferase